MIEAISRNLIRVLLLIALQVLVFNNIGLGQLFNPFVYVFALLFLPLTIPVWLLLIISFSIGLSVDFLSDTGGLHAGASTLLAFIRPHWLKIIYPRSGYEDEGFNVSDFDLPRFITYGVGLTFAHHFYLFFVESMRFSEIHWIFLKTILSTLLTFVFILILRAISTKPQRR